MKHCPNCGHGLAAPQAYGLTRSQADLLRLIEGFVVSHGIPPTYQQMLDLTGISSKSRIHYIIQGLIKRGRVVTIPGNARSIKVIAPSSPECPSAGVEARTRAASNARPGNPLFCQAYGKA